MTDIVLRWAGPADAAAASTYKIERSLNNVNWSVLAAAQAATSPYVSVSNTLNGAHAYGVATITVVSGTSLASSGYGWLDDALVQWTGKSTNDLTGVTWHSGYGTYATGTTLYQAHESYADSGVTITLNAVLYRITHTNTAGEISAPVYVWYYSPPTPASSDHCVVIVNIHADLGIEARATINVDAYLAADTDYADTPGAHLDAQTSTNKRVVSNAFGLAFFHCWKSSTRNKNLAYTFVLDATLSSTSQTETVTTIPDRDWVLLADLI
jgi:hypothetical protein